MRVMILLAIGALLSGCGPDRSLDRGVALFAQNCAVCHGADARGGGGANVPGLSKTPSDLTVLAAENNGFFPTRKTLAVMQGYADGSHAGRRMTPFVDLTSDKRRRIKTSAGTVRAQQPQADLLSYLVSVQRP